MDQNTLHLIPDLEFWPNLDPDPRVMLSVWKKCLIVHLLPLIYPGCACVDPNRIRIHNIAMWTKEDLSPSGGNKKQMEPHKLCH